MTVRNLKWLAVLATGVAVVTSVPAIAFARGGGHGGGHGGFHGGGHHGGGHAYHPSAAHHAHHTQHHDNHHYDHHHHDWHHGGWWPYAGAFGLGYGLGWWGGGYGGWGYGGGDYVDNSDNSQTIDNSTTSTDGSDDSSNVAANVQNPSQQGMPVDTWPGLGISTYAGQYGNQQGLVVVRVVPQSAGARAGLVPGDVILTFNGQPVPDADTLDTLMSSAGGKFEATVWDARTGRKSTLSGALDPNAPAAQQ